jgi:ABC-type amino acid transport substrate-binding protein
MSAQGQTSSILFSIKNLIALTLIGCVSLGAFAAQEQSSNTAAVAPIKLWNGNKTESRQQYEREILEAALNATAAAHGNYQLQEDKTDYPLAADEASVFRSKGFDIFGTVAGNAKLANEKKILIPLPLMKGLLGYRILIIRAVDKEKFAAIKSAKQLQQLRMGIPSTWADAELFRHNGYKVEEKGSFDDLFARLENNEFDYVTFGANEVTGVFSERAAKSGKLIVDSSLLVFYPFPLVFYVNPDNKTLAARVTEGLQIISANGELDKIFNRYFAADLASVNLPTRAMIKLKNPILPAEMADFKPSL